MPNIKEQEERIVEFINLRLLCDVDDIDKEMDIGIKMSFIRDDLEQFECGRETLYLILQKLKREGFIENITDDEDDPLMKVGQIIKEASAAMNSDAVKHLNLDFPEELKKAFCFTYVVDVMPRKFFKRVKKQENESQNLISPVNNDKKMEIFFNKKTGVLYKEPKNKFCRKFRGNSDTFKIIDILMEKNGNLIATDNIRRKTRCSGNIQTRKLISKLKMSIKNNLKISDLIEAHQPNGYRINTDKYRVVILKE